MNDAGDHETAFAFLSASSFWTPEWMPSRSGWHEHVPFAFWLTEIHRPRSLVELGTHWGVSYMAFCQSVKKYQTGTKCYAIDTWKGDKHASFYGEEVFTTVNEYNLKHYADFSTLIRLPFDQALNQFPDGSIDLLHIDGEHSYEAVKRDWETWRPKMSNRGIVLFHDTNELKSDFGVVCLWKELVSKHPHFEFTHGHGLGILGIGKGSAPVIRSLFALQEDCAATAVVRRIYSRLGEAISLAVKLHEANIRLKKVLNDSAKSLEQQGVHGTDVVFQMDRQHAVLIGQIRLLEADLQTLREEKNEEIRNLQGTNGDLQNALNEMEAWQQSWLRRTLGRWHRTRKKHHPPFLARWARSLRKRLLNDAVQNAKKPGRRAREP